MSALQTKYTREVLSGKKNPTISMWNGKPFRTKYQKQEARKLAQKCEDGAVRSESPVSYHPRPRGE